MIVKEKKSRDGEEERRRGTGMVEEIDCPLMIGLREYLEKMENHSMTPPVALKTPEPGMKTLSRNIGAVTFPGNL